MSKKVTWHDLYKEFKLKFPRKSTEAIYFKPYDHMVIEIWFENGSISTYDGLTKTLTHSKETWK